MRRTKEEAQIIKDKLIEWDKSGKLAGMTMRQISKSLKFPEARDIYHFLRSLGLSKSYKHSDPSTWQVMRFNSLQERRDDMWERYNVKGQSLQMIAHFNGLTRERVRQIIAKEAKSRGVDMDIRTLESVEKKWQKLNNLRRLCQISKEHITDLAKVNRHSVNIFFGMKDKTGYYKASRAKRFGAADKVETALMELVEEHKQKIQLLIDSL